MRGPNVPWVVAALQTAESTNLQQIIIYFSADLGSWNQELFHREWQDLDRLLLRFWTSHSIRPKIEYGKEETGHGLRELVSWLLPELTSRGVIDLVKYK